MYTRGVCVTGAIKHGSRSSTPEAAAAGSGVPHATASPTRIMIMIGAIAPIAFLVVATLIGIFQPGYQVSTQSVSDVAVGNFGWLMDANFFALGLSTIAFAVGLFRTLRRRSYAGTLLLVVVGLATFAAGLFPTDLKGAPQTSTGGVHNLLFLVVFLGLILSYPFTAFALRHEPDLRDLALPVALLSIVIFGALFVFIGFGSDP